MNLRRALPASIIAGAMLLNVPLFAQTAPVSDAMVMKTGPATATAGANVAYDVLVTNIGPDPTGTLSLSDAIPAGMTFVSAAQNSGPAFTCTTPAVGSGGTVNCTVAAMNAGESADFTITLQITVDAAPGTFFVNTATVSTANDPNPENDSSVAVTNTPFPPQSDIGVVKSGPNSAAPGTNVSYALTVTNGGPDAGQTVTISDTLPGSMTFVSLTQTSGPAFTCSTPAAGSGGTISCSIATLAAATSATFTLVANIPAATAAGATFQNTATVSTITADPNPENDASTTALIVSSTDIGVAKSGPASVTAGGSAVYTIAVTNNGPDTATNVGLTDTLPAGTTFTSLTTTAGPIANCTTPPPGTNGSIFCTWPVLGNGAISTLSLTTGVLPSVVNGTTLTNTASVSSETADTNAANNTSSTSATVATQADLSVTKSAPASATAGTTVTYTITAANAGPSNAASVALSDTTPAGTTFVSLAQTAGPTFTCTTPAVGASGTISCNVASLTAGASATFSLTLSISPAASGGSAITNTTTITSTAIDPAPGNNSATATTTVSVIADPAISKSGPPSITAGANITYTIVVSDNGPSDAASVSWSDTVPANTTFVSLAQTAGPAFTCTAPAAGGTGAITCNIPVLASGSSGTFSLVVASANTLTTGTTISNTATVTSTTTDALPGNNSATFVSTVGVGAADVSITKSAPTPVEAGTPFTWTLTVANAGPSAAQSVVVTDALPAGTTLVTATPSQGTCSGTTTVTCQLGTIINGATATIALNVTASTTGYITNTASVAATSPDTLLSNNTASATVGVVAKNAIPTLSGSVLILLAIGLALAASAALRR